LAIKIDKAALEQACKEIIQTILFILPNAHKGTVYRIGGPPTMIARRITSGVIDEKRERISWGLPERSDYNPPGKPWEEYMDRADRPLEAMAWCVEKQKSWTAENPSRDVRSVRMQVEGVREDYHHMEPVLIRKEDLYLGNGSQAEYPFNIKGEQLWSHSDYVVIAVIKIHFTPYTIKIGSPETRIIKRLSRALGTELLSYQLREQSFEAMRHLAEDKINSCNILADSLRNLITKSGLIFSLIKLEMGSLRARWEGLLLRNSDQRKMKLEAIHALNNILWEINEPSSSVVRDLVEQQNKLLDLYLPPERGENWVKMQIEERWNSLIEKGVINREQVSEVHKRIGELKRSLYLGRDPELLDRYDVIPESLKEEWVELLYRNTDSLDLEYLESLIAVLENPSLDMPYQEKSRKTLTHLKTLAEVVGQLEDNTNMVLREVLNGSENGMNPDTFILKGMDAHGLAQNVPNGVSEASPSIDKPAR
jgi:hypothetical protein